MSEPLVLPQADRAFEELDRVGAPAIGVCANPGLLEELGLESGLVGELGGLLEVPLRGLVRRERGRAPPRPGQSLPGGRPDLSPASSARGSAL